MRFLPGAAAGLIVALGVSWAKLSGPKIPQPPESFLDSELTNGNASQTGSCYSLRLVLRHHLFLTPGAVPSWQPIGDEDWMFKVEWIENNGSGPVSAWEKMTFRTRNGRIEPQVIDTSSQGNVPVEPFIKELLSYPHDRRAQKIARCRTS